MQVIVYLLLGLGAFGGVFYALSQIAGRQRRLHAELTRLEQLTAEVAMTAEAMLDKIDERIERMNRIAARAEERLDTKTAAAAAPADPTPAAPAPAAPARTVAPGAYAAAAAAYATAASPAAPVNDQPVDGQPVKRKRGRPRKHPLPAAPGPAAAGVATPAAQGTGVTTQAVPTAGATPSADMSQRSAKVQAVFKLAAEGKSVPEIAALLAIPRGEVQLILNLRKVTA